VTELVVGNAQTNKPYTAGYDARKQRVVFRYSLGDFCLFRVGFDALLSRLPFDPECEPFKFPDENPAFPEGIAIIGYSGAIVTQDMPRLCLRRTGFYYAPNRDINYYINLRQTFTAYLEGFSGKTRSTLRRKVRRVSQTLEFRFFRTIDEALDFHRAARQIAPKTYQEKLFNGAIPDTPEFIREIRNRAARNEFRGFALFRGEQPVSYLYLPIENGVVTYGYLGYDPQFSKLSVGTTLLYLSLENIFNENIYRYFDFTHGDGETKRSFGRTTCFRADIYFFRWTLRNAVIVLTHLATTQLSAGLGRILSVLGLREPIRKLLRGL
jgi:hypothetical protein